MSTTRNVLALLTAFAVMPAMGGTTVYEIDPTHTFPSIEADHMGMSVWRGKFDRTTGQIAMDKTAGTGTLSVEIDLGSVNFGLDALDVLMAKPEYFDTTRHPKATYTGKLAGFVDGKPTRVDGELTLRGVTRPVTLDVKSFKCMPHRMSRHDWCGADAYATINREEFGIAAGKDWGFSMDIGLRIQVEAMAVPSAAGSGRGG